jgi:hypothetical protein
MFSIDSGEHHPQLEPGRAGLCSQGIFRKGGSAMKSPFIMLARLILLALMAVVP